MAAAIAANRHFVLYFADIGTLSNKINRQCISFAGFASGGRYTGRFIRHIQRCCLYLLGMYFVTAADACDRQQLRAHETSIG